MDTYCSSMLSNAQLIRCVTFHAIHCDNFDYWGQSCLMRPHTFHNSAFSSIFFNKIVSVRQITFRVLQILAYAIRKTCHTCTLIRMKRNESFHTGLSTCGTVLARATPAFVYINITITGERCIGWIIHALHNSALGCVLGNKIVDARLGGIGSVDTDTIGETGHTSTSISMERN